MTRQPDVLILGGGIAGLTTALALARGGQSVVVLDEPRAGAASRAAAGMLAPALEFPPGLIDAAIAARDSYPAFLDMLHEATGIRVPLDRNGIIELAHDEMHTSPIPPASTRLDVAALRTLEPNLSSAYGGLLHPLDGAIDPRRLMDALVQAVASHANIARIRGAVVALSVHDGGGFLVTDDARQYSAPRVVIASGAWAGGLDGLPRPIPVRPVRGELMLLAGHGLEHVVYGAGGYLVPREDGILVGATSEDAGFASVTTDAGRVALLAIAARAMPSLARTRIVDHWAGLRPMSPDQLPILGVDPDYPALAYACGMSRNGILFAPWAAEQLALELAGEQVPELEPFRLERFDSDLKPHTEPSA